ncbi:hypothetical protein ACLH0K_02650 [Arthrobacter sp. MPF02]
MESVSGPATPPRAAATSAGATPAAMPSTPGTEATISLAPSSPLPAV